MFAVPTLVALIGLALPQENSEPKVESTLQDLLPRAEAEERQLAFDEVARSRDRRFLAPMLDLLRFADTREEWFHALNGVGAILGEDLTELQRPWYHLTLRLAGDETLPFFGDYARWKGELLAQRVDPRFKEFLYAGVAARVRLDEVVWGGVTVDGIPALVDPRSMPAKEATYLADSDPVFGVSIGDDQRAYPLRILDWHEMANDVVGGVPIALAYCTLCAAGIAYRAELDGERIQFGSSGLLMRSNKLMFDRGTKTLWNQLTGAPVIGELVERDIQLDVLPIVLTTWGAWKQRHPGTRVLDPETGHRRDYRLGAAYGSYFGGDRLMFPAYARGLAPDARAKDQVFVVRVDGAAKAFELGAIRARRVVNDTLDPHSSKEVVLIHFSGEAAVPLPEAWVEPIANFGKRDARFFGDISIEELMYLLDEELPLVMELEDAELLALAPSVRTAFADALGARDALEPELVRIRERLTAGLALRGLVGEVRAYARAGQFFEAVEPDTLRDESGRAWSIEEDALTGPAAERLERLPGHLVYRFGWEAFLAPR